MSEELEIRDRAHAAEIAGKLRTLRKSIAATKALEATYRKALVEWMAAFGEDAIERESEPTLRRHSGKIQSYVWNLVNAEPADLKRLQELGLLTVNKGQYDEAVRKVGPLGLLEKYAHPQYSEELRFDEEAR